MPRPIYPLDPIADWQRSPGAAARRGSMSREDTMKTTIAGGTDHMRPGLLRRPACWASRRPRRGGAARIRCRRMAQPISRAAGSASPSSSEISQLRSAAVLDGQLPADQEPLRQPARVHARTERRSRASRRLGQIAPDNTSVTLTLRKDVKFHSGTPFNAEAVAANLKKAADPQNGKNVYATMSFVKDWTVVDPNTIRLNFNGSGARAADHRPAAVHLDHRSRRHRHGRDEARRHRRLHAGRARRRPAHRLTANPNYWREKQPVSKEARAHDLQR